MMLGKLREFVNKSPWLGWVLFVAVLGLAVVLWFIRSKGTDPYTPERMVEEVTVRFTDTNDEVKMTRGQLDKELRRRGDKLDAAQGIINPKTGQPTGFIFSKAEWEEMITRINQEKEEARTASGKLIKPAPRDEPKPMQPAPAGTAPAPK